MAWDFNEVDAPVDGHDPLEDCAASDVEDVPTALIDPCGSRAAWWELGGGVAVVCRSRSRRVPCSFGERGLRLQVTRYRTLAVDPIDDDGAVFDREVKTVESDRRLTSVGRQVPPQRGN